MFPGGIAALLLQSLHPSAMAGVAGHSGYKGDPWGRLQRTSHYLAVTTFGTVPDAEEAIAHVRSVHRRVRGKDELGRPYAADDPHLLRWVHVAEIWSFLKAFQAYSGETLNAEEEHPLRPSRPTWRPRASVRPTCLRRWPISRRSSRATARSCGPPPRPGKATRFMLLHPPVPVGGPTGLCPDRRRRGRPAARLGPPRALPAQCSAPASPRPPEPVPCQRRWSAGAWPASATPPPPSGQADVRPQSQVVEHEQRA